MLVFPLVRGGSCKDVVRGAGREVSAAGRKAGRGVYCQHYTENDFHGEDMGDGGETN